MRIHLRTWINKTGFQYKKYRWGHIFRLSRYSLCIDFDKTYVGRLLLEKSKQSSILEHGENIQSRLEKLGLTWADVDEKEGKFIHNGHEYIIAGFSRYKDIRKNYLIRQSPVIQ